MGAQKWGDITSFDDVQTGLNTLKSKGYQVIATTPHENDCLLDDFDTSKQVLSVLHWF